MIKVCVLSVVCNVHTTDIYTDIYDTPVVFVTMIQILDEKLTVSYSELLAPHKSWDQLMSPPTLKVMDEKFTVSYSELTGCTTGCSL